MVQSSRGPKNGKLYETIAVSALWSRKPPACSVPHHPRIQMEEQRTLKAESYLVKPMNKKNNFVCISKFFQCAQL